MPADETAGAANTLGGSGMMTVIAAGATVSGVTGRGATVATVMAPAGGEGSGGCAVVGGGRCGVSAGASVVGRAIGSSANTLVLVAAAVSLVTSVTDTEASSTAMTEAAGVGVAVVVVIVVIVRPSGEAGASAAAAARRAALATTGDVMCTRMPRVPVPGIGTPGVARGPGDMAGGAAECTGDITTAATTGGLAPAGVARTTESLRDRATTGPRGVCAGEPLLGPCDAVTTGDVGRPSSSSRPCVGDPGRGATASEAVVETRGVVPDCDETAAATVVAARGVAAEAVTVTAPPSGSLRGEAPEGG